ncbi:MAG: ATP-binding protein [Azospirillaceae bacterium]|nr:ATP-binding protein [Azospirillaceae bacterium]
MLAVCSKQDLSIVLETIAIIAYAFDLSDDGHWQFAAVNERFETAIGVNRTMLVGRPVHEALASDLAVPLLLHLDRCASCRIKTEFDEHLPLSAGSTWWHSVLTPLFVADRACRIIGTSFAVAEMVSIERWQRSTQQQFVDMLASLQNAVLLIDPRDMAIVMANRTAERLFDSAPGGLAGLSYLALVTPEQRGIADQITTEITAGFRESIKMQRHFMRRSGDPFWGDVMAVKISPPLTRRTLWAALIEDTDALKTTRQRLRDAVEASPSGFAVFDADDRLSLCNTRYAHDLGYPNAEVMQGLSFMALIRHSLAGPQGVDPEGSDEIWLERRTQWHRQADGTPHEVKTRDGRWWLISENLTSEGGRVLTRADVTTLKTREIELRQHDALLRHGATMARLGYWIWDERTGQCLFCSDQLATILGMTVARFHDTLATRDRLIARIHAEDRQRCRMVIAESRAEASSYHIEFRIRTESGDYRHIRETATYLADRGDGAPHSVGVFQDITEQKSRELELELSRARLERQTTELTRLTEHLDQTARAAQAANRAKSDFLAQMSHELRTPLNAIVGFSEMLLLQLAGPIDSKAHEYAGDIQTAAHHLLELINNLLDLAKIEAGRFELDEQPVDLPHLLRRSIRMIEKMAAARNIDLTTEVAPLPPLIADERGLQRILINLLSNAIKFSEPGGQVSTRIDLNDQGEPTLSVQDRGIGIPSNEVERIFEPFFQTSYTRTHRYSGTGLGLPIVLSLVNLHGGRLKIASTVGVGTTVTVHLPRSRLLSPPPAS